MLTYFPCFASNIRYQEIYTYINNNRKPYCFYLHVSCTSFINLVIFASVHNTQENEITKANK